MAIVFATHDVMWWHKPIALYHFIWAESVWATKLIRSKNEVKKKLTRNRHFQTGFHVDKFDSQAIKMKKKKKKFVEFQLDRIHSAFIDIFQHSTTKNAMNESTWNEMNEQFFFSLNILFTQTFGTTQSHPIVIPNRNTYTHIAIWNGLNESEDRTTKIETNWTTETEWKYT